MGALSTKLRNAGTETDKRLMFWCPGCNQAHGVRIAGGRPCWGWDGNAEAPTFTPSVLVTMPWRNMVCHSFVRAGMIEFLGDCTHALKGQTVPLPDWPAEP